MSCFYSMFCFAVGPLYLVSHLSAGINKVLCQTSLGMCGEVVLNFLKKAFMSSFHILSAVLWDTYSRPHTVSTLDRKAPYNQPLHWRTCRSLSPWTMLVLRKLERSCSRSWKHKQDSKWSQSPFTSNSDPSGSADSVLLLLVQRKHSHFGDFLTFNACLKTAVIWHSF